MKTTTRNMFLNEFFIKYLQLPWPFNGVLVTLLPKSTVDLSLHTSVLLSHVLLAPSSGRLGGLSGPMVVGAHRHQTAVC